MRLDFTFLHSRVARRIFVLFICCALLPIVALTLIAFRTVSRQLIEQGRRQLLHASKAEGMEEYARLDSMEGETQIAALHLLHGYSPVLSAAFRARFRNATRFSPLTQKQEVLLGHVLHLPPFSSEQEQHLQSGKALLVTETCADGDGICPSMVRLIDPARPAAGVLMAEINPGYLWDLEKLPFGVSLCVYSAGAPLLCDDNAALQNAVSAGIQKEDRLFAWKASGVAYQAGAWKLFLRARFLAPDWTIVLSERQEQSLAPMRHFRATFPFVILLALLAVVLLSSIQIRRTLVPLEKLTRGTEHIGAQHFESRVEVRSGDEFEELARSFNSMATRLGTQFYVLRTVHDIDQAILASLHRGKIIAAVLKHMPDLLPHACFAVALLDDPQLDHQPSLNVSIPSANLFGRRLKTSVSLQDRDHFQAAPQSWQVAAEDAIPEFLAPLKAEGMRSFLILPVQVDGKPFGALVCAHPRGLAADHPGVEPARQVADQLAVAFSNVQLMEALEQLHWGALSALARAIDAKSTWTAGHSERVTQLAVRIGRAMGLSLRDLHIMHRGGLLHDIGKIGTPHQILDKPGKLDAAEMQTMRDHVRIGMRILEPIPGLAEALPIVAQHHEWFDGRGYPAGLAGEQISLHARIFAVADCYDALISDRPYRPGLPREKVLDIIRSGSGTQFDPRVIEVFLSIFDEDTPPPPQAELSASVAQPS